MQNATYGNKDFVAADCARITDAGEHFTAIPDARNQRDSNFNKQLFNLPEDAFHLVPPKGAQRLTLNVAE